MIKYLCEKEDLVFVANAYPGLAGVFVVVVLVWGGGFFCCFFGCGLGLFFLKEDFSENGWVFLRDNMYNVSALLRVHGENIQSVQPNKRKI